MDFVVAKDLEKEKPAPNNSILKNWLADNNTKLISEISHYFFFRRRSFWKSKQTDQSIYWLTTQPLKNIYTQTFKTQI